MVHGGAGICPRPGAATARIGRAWEAGRVSLRLVLNGRFLGRPVTGVDRFSLELVRSMRTILAELGAADIDVLVPQGTALTDEQIAGLGDPGPTITRVGRSGGHQWEQRELAAIRPESWQLDL